MATGRWSGIGLADAPQKLGVREHMNQLHMHEHSVRNCELQLDDVRCHRQARDRAWGDVGCAMRVESGGGGCGMAGCDARTSRYRNAEIGIRTMYYISYYIQYAVVYTYAIYYERGSYGVCSVAR